MTQKIIIDLGQRTMGGIRLRWNKLTPTRWGKTTGESISNASRQGPITVSIGDQLIVSDSRGTFPVFRSDAYAANLKRTGIKQIPVSQGETRGSVLKTLDTLTDRSPEEAKVDLEARGLQVEIKPSIKATGFIQAFREFRSIHPIGERKHLFFYNEDAKGGKILFLGSLIGMFGGFGLGVLAFNMTFVTAGTIVGLAGGFVVGLIVHLTIATLSAFGLARRAVKNFASFVELKPEISRAQDPSTSADELLGFSEHPFSYLRMVAARNSSLSIHILFNLINDVDARVRTVAEKAVPTNSAVVKEIELINDPSTPETELLRLSKCPLAYVRIAVARSSKLPISNLMDLIKDTDVNVRSAAETAIPANTSVAKEIEHVNSPLTSAAELLRLSRHPLTYIKIALASQRASEDAHTVLANDDSIAVKTALAANPWITDRVVDRLSIDVSLDSFWELLALNWAASPEKVAWLINAKIKMSNPEVPYRAAVEGGTYEIVHCTGTYGEEGQIEIIVVEPVSEQEYSPASYSVGDYSKAAAIINSHLIEKRQQILAELRLLNPELATGILNI